jgi:hypothetical protein
LAYNSAEKELTIDKEDRLGLILSERQFTLEYLEDKNKKPILFDNYTGVYKLKDNNTTQTNSLFFERLLPYRNLNKSYLKKQPTYLL